MLAVAVISPWEFGVLRLYVHHSRYDELVVPKRQSSAWSITILNSYFLRDIYVFCGSGKKSSFRWFEITRRSEIQIPNYSVGRQQLTVTRLVTITDLMRIYMALAHSKLLGHNLWLQSRLGDVGPSLPLHLYMKRVMKKPQESALSVKNNVEPRCVTFSKFLRSLNKKQKKDLRWMWCVVSNPVLLSYLG